jgi:CDP-diacylglycerol--serine O-phosphatidyltransferase
MANEKDKSVKKVRHQSIYLLPNLFTTGCLFAGFYSIIMAVNGDFEKSAVAIFVAMVLDSLDGRVARLTNSTSSFGENYDSLADIVSFGIAPAIVSYVWILQYLGKLGWLAAFIYLAGAALRLARFNSRKGYVDQKFFQGLPCPAAAALIAGLVWVITDFSTTGSLIIPDDYLSWLVWSIVIYAGFCMISILPYYSFKDLKLRKSVPFLMVVLIALGLVLVSQDPPLIIFITFIFYSFSGFFLYLYRRAKGFNPGLIDEENIFETEFLDSDKQPNHRRGS